MLGYNIIISCQSHLHCIYHMYGYVLLDFSVVIFFGVRPKTSKQFIQQEANHHQKGHK